MFRRSLVPRFARKPYIEKSRKDRERYEREMVAYNERLTDKITKEDCKTEANVDDYYHVSLETEVETGEFPNPDESIAQFAIRLMGSSALELDFLQMDWDFDGSFHIPI